MRLILEDPELDISYSSKDCTDERLNARASRRNSCKRSSVANVSLESRFDPFMSAEQALKSYNLTEGDLLCCIIAGVDWERAYWGLWSMYVESPVLAFGLVKNEEEGRRGYAAPAHHRTYIRPGNLH